MSKTVVFSAIFFIVGLALGVGLTAHEQQYENDWSKMTPNQKILSKCSQYTSPVNIKLCADAEADLIKRGLD